MFDKLKIGLSALVLTVGVSSSALAYDRHVTLINDSSNDIVEFYGSNTGTSDWQEDILGVDTLESGEEANIDFDDETGHCMFDFKAIFDDGSEAIEEQFNVCELSTVTVTD